MTVLVKPATKIELMHRAYYSSHGLNNGLIVFASSEGDATVISPNLVVQTTIKRPTKIKDVAVHPFLPVLGFVEDEDNHLTIVDLDGQTIHQSLFSETEEPPGFDIEGSGSSHFERDGLHLWYAFARSSDDVEIQWLDCNTWSIAHKIVIEDPYGESHISLHSTDATERVALWLAGGQDGQQVYWLTIGEEGIVCEAEPLLEDTTPPVFSPSGHGFLAIEGETIVNKYSFPDLRLVGTYEWTEDEEEALGELVCYVDDKSALIISGEGRVFLMDLVAMALSEDVFVEGHEPQPVPVYHPTLVNDQGLCTDISRIERFGDTVVFVFQREDRTVVSPWKDTLLFVPLTAFTN
ncbi:MAG: hypothetical protein ACRYFS_10485 [Janthinobacterium lividum]